ncbi:macro domain-containing protein [Saccharothrix violaceirubra]|uniref:O-acetyl-ADP-ribose deacetylase (Regulator of RNase III) n=1 Tax=Saccharothrix violaceirubra TaxID=413306 RepID=A0A7W7WSZ8_9PSEU|nr:macro domain-containing protein [Saccharothrix violaceirubra]MBB4962675.1 O-acetyl-ADP-ribose deacetylase (regulator of RNase III) [Saccharothrix violaceirubra]
MIAEVRGNLLEAEADAIVNAVNTVGVMGKGIALAFKRAYPKNHAEYHAACARGELEVGRLLIHETGLEVPRYVINLPTKRHWRSRSRLADVVAGIAALREALVSLDVRSVAVPALGCGNGGLSWSEVGPAPHAGLADLPDVDIRLYLPN